MHEGGHLVFGLEQELANDRIDDGVWDLERQLVAVNLDAPVQRVIAQHDPIGELELFGRRQCLVLAPFLVVLWFHVFGHDIGVEVGPVRLVCDARGVLPVCHVDLPPKVFTKQANRLNNRGCLDVAIRHAQPELLFVGRLLRAQLFLWRHDHYSEAEVRKKVLSKVCKSTCNCNRPNVHRFAHLDNAWFILWKVGSGEA